MKRMWSCVSIKSPVTKLSFLSALFVCLAAPLHAGSPQWFRDAAQAKLPTYDADVNAVILLDEEVVTVSDSGEVKTTHRVAKKILNAHGREHATVRISFDGETKIANVHAWSIPPSGKEYELKDKDAYEFAAYDGELYSDNRYKRLELPSDPGSIIGYEYEQKGRPRIFTENWYYQDELPVLTSRFTLSLPPAWELETFWVNREKMEAVKNGNTFTWEEQNIPRIKDEDSMPDWRAVAARMVVAFYPPSGKSNRAHTSWEDLGTWYYGLATPQRQPNAAIQTTAAQLTAGKAGFLDKLRPIARFAQRDVRYVAIEIGIGGYQPHSAASVFQNRYGDCKDKATVMAALLDSVGIKSYYVVAQTERGVIAPNAPSMHSFNHVILAVQVPKEVTLPPGFAAVVDNEKTGKLLIFDPTDEVTPLGLLPPHLQGNYGLLTLESGSALIPLPKPEPQVNELARTAKLSLSPDGMLSGKVTEVRRGAEAWSKRYQLRTLPVADRRKAFENAMAPFLTAFSLKDFTIDGLDDNDKDLVVTYSFEAPSYSKKMGPMFLVRPRVFGSKLAYMDLNKKERKFPFEFSAVSSETDEFSIDLPPGFTVDELPPPTEVKDGALEYQSTTAFSGQTLTYKRKYKVGDTLFPADKRADLLRFYSKVQQDEGSSAVLRKQ